MSYATIEEAWGGLAPAPEETQTPQLQSPRRAPKRIRPRVSRPKPRQRGPKPVVIHGQDPPMFRDGQAFVQAVYAKYGVAGIRELLGKDITSRLCGHRKSARKNDLWSLHGPMTFEKTLLILAALFGGALLLNALFKPAGSVGGSPPPW